MSHEIGRALRDLEGRWPESRVGPSLARIAALMNLLGDPQWSAPVIQISGTNGKGTTALIIDGLLRAQGLRTGRYASPHLSEPRERINLDGAPISQEDFARVWAEIAPYVAMVDAELIDGIRLTAFEAMTGMAYACFADAPVDVMIIEVGMGGTWDATSVADAQVAVFTPIDLDHTDYLGTTLTQIATEKAGIIKLNSQVVMADQEPEVASVLLGRAGELGRPVVRAGRDFTVLTRRLAVGGQTISLESAGGPTPEIFLPLYGRVMAENAALAVAAVEAFAGGRELEPDLIEDGFAEVVAPGRTERVQTGPPIVIDTCHNRQAVAATLETMAEAFAFDPQIAIWGMMADKDHDAVLEQLEPAISSLILTEAKTVRALSAGELAERAAQYFPENRLIISENLVDAIDTAVALADEAGPGAGILIGGSAALAGEARRLLKG